MERHDTHLLSCSSSMDNSYKYDKNGNAIYTHPSKLDDPEGGTLSDDDLKAHGWKFSSKHGLHGQIQDPTRLPK